jgi:ABC-type multidrug transport system ATPase subunit
VIKLFNVTIERSRQVILDNASLEIREGDILGISGPSGAGKSTLLNVAALLVPPSQGKVEVAGSPVRAGDPDFIRAVGVTLLQQSLGLWPHMTAGENILLPWRYSPRRVTQKRLDKLSDMLGIQNLLSRFPSSLSGGERQRIALARHLAIGPQHLLLDEPTSALDTGHRESVVQILRELLKEGTSITISSHDQKLFQDLGANILRIESGRIMNEQSLSTKGSFANLEASGTNL